MIRLWTIIHVETRKSEEPMNWSIHHVNLPAHNVQESASFYKEILGLADGPTPKTIGAGHGKFERSSDAYVFIGDGDRGLHIVRPIPSFARDNGFTINPVVSGHFAITVPDLAAVRRRLDAAGIFYCNAGDYAMPGVRQLYVYDPSMNCVEVNQID
jgi:catechol 2,3-dioxygenase-like lactoylglutathione lyase family enzyme